MCVFPAENIKWFSAVVGSVKGIMPEIISGCRCGIISLSVCYSAGFGTSMCLTWQGNKTQ